MLSPCLHGSPSGFPLSKDMHAGRLIAVKCP